MHRTYIQQLSSLSVQANSGHGQQACSRNSELCQNTRQSIISETEMNTAGKLEEQVGRLVLLILCRSLWAALYISGLLIKLTPKGVVYSVLFFSFSRH